MSGFLSLPSLGNVFNRAGSAGPRRLAFIGLGIAAIVSGVFAVASIRPSEPVTSRPGPLPRINPLPGGLRSNPQQDALSVIDNQEQAERARQAGDSFTPVMPASRAYDPPIVKQPASPAAPPAPRFQPAPTSVAQPPPAAPAVVTRAGPPPVRTVIVAAPQAPPGAVPAVVQQTPVRSPQEDAAFQAALARMMAGWGGKMPRTEVILPPDDGAAAEGGGASGAGQPRRRGTGDGEGTAPAALSATQVANSAARQTVLIPAGRGIYAHTILAANSDAQSPVVLQADSGPIAGDRMIGSFSRQRTRLVIRITKLIHQNQEIGVDGVVVAPGTMEAGVASSVDQNYLERFALPAAAAFIQGLGQAIAQSNSTSVLGPLGSVTAQNKLNIDQQLGIAAGVAAAQVGSELQQSTPHGPTVILDVGSSVGVLFLTNVAAANN
jgi:intracellular multiplication protein IcmE